MSDDTAADRADASGQANEDFDEPTRDEIPVITREHVKALMATDDESVWVMAGMAHVIIRTVGRRSGKEHTITVPYWRDPEGHRVVVASFAGAPNHPAWYFNLADPEANPEVWMKERSHEFWAEPQVLDGDEYARIWDLLTTDRPFYLDYQSRTERRLPLIRLVETRPA